MQAVFLCRLVPLAAPVPHDGDGTAGRWQGGGAMNADQFYGIARHVVSAAGGIALTLGTVDANVINQVTGAVLALAAIAASWWSKKSK